MLTDTEIREIAGDEVLRYMALLPLSLADLLETRSAEFGLDVDARQPVLEVLAEGIKLAAQRFDAGELS